MIAEILAKYGLRLLFTAAIVALIGGWLSSVYNGIYEKGAAEERVKWQQKEAQATELRNKKIKEMAEAVLVLEKSYADRFAEIKAEHKKETEDAYIQKQRDIAAARSGALKLRWAAKAESGSGGNATGDSAGTSSACNGSTAGELPRETSANLLALVDDADRNTKQLTSCQKVVTEYKKFRCTPYKETSP
jgi:hypothetical protein